MSGAGLQVSLLLHCREFTCKIIRIGFTDCKKKKEHLEFKSKL